MTEAQLLDGDAFNRLVIEQGLDGRTWEQNGYIYLGFRGKDGYELYRTYGPKWQWLYMARRVATNANAAGHPILVDITMPAGISSKLVNMYAAQTTTGTHSFYAEKYDEDNAVNAQMAGVATAASIGIYLPSIGSNAAASGNLMNSQNLFINPGEKLTIRTAGDSGVANDTVTIGLTLMIPTKTEPTWSVARSADAANITLAASTISAANTWQAVMIPWPL